MKGETIKEKLSILGRTQKELAGLLGITPQAVNEILSASDVRSGSVEKIARAVGVPVSFFFENDFSREDLALNVSKKVKIRATNNIGIKVRLLLRQKHKKLVDLCQYVGMSDVGMRKVFERDTCNIDTLIKMSEYFGVSVNHFLPKNAVAQDFDKDREIEFLKGQIKAYEKALRALSSFSNEQKLQRQKLPKLSVG